MRLLKYLLSWIFLLISFFSSRGVLYASAFFVPSTMGLSFVGDFGGPLLKKSKAGEKLFDLEITPDNNLTDNLKKIFYPDMTAKNTLWKAIRNISVGILLVFLVWAWVYFFLFAPDNEEDLKHAWKSILYIIYGAALLFLVIWILWTALDITNVHGVVWDTTGGDSTLLENFENNLLIVVLSFLKGAAFFMAIIFLIWYGYQMMQAFSEEEKLKNARKWVLNVFLALVFIKIIDYIYFVAQQTDFKNLAIEFIVQVSKFLWYLWGIMFVIALIYGGYQLVTASWDEEKVKKAKTVVKSVFVIILIILLFMLVIYQVFNDLL